MKTKISSPLNPFGLPKAQANIRAWPSTRWMLRRLLVLVIALVLLGSSVLPAELARNRAFTMAIGGNSWDLVGWEIDALWEKAEAGLAKPADEVSPALAPDLVQQYLARASRIGEIERELARRAVLEQVDESAASNDELSFELATLRDEQGATRIQVEQIIERQVAHLLYSEGYASFGDRVWPPVSFTFVEPPKKLVVSRRDRIETIHSQMLAAQMSLAEIEQAEREIGEQYNAVGYVTDIGGLGAFPTMVVDRASLRWVLSTVAHEWVHNYLVFFPLGWNYFTSQDLTTMNETVAEIVGNEIGDLVLARYYPESVPPTLPPRIVPLIPSVVFMEPEFDFQTEMRLTRLEVDRLLGLGEVEAAEVFMDERRQEFVANGYPLRVLNQAYFAFHGSYGTSAASTSPIGPKLENLRALTPDVRTFLEIVRGFTSPGDLDASLAEWQELSNAQS